MKQKIATIFGASGFIGRHLIRRLTEKDFRIIVATRSPYLSQYLKPLGNPGQIDLEKLVNLFDKERLRVLIKNSDVVINCVGIFIKQTNKNLKIFMPNFLTCYQNYAVN